MVPVKHLEAKESHIFNMYLSFTKMLKSPDLVIFLQLTIMMITNDRIDTALLLAPVWGNYPVTYLHPYCCNTFSYVEIDTASF